MGAGLAAGLGGLMIKNELEGGTEQSQRLRKYTNPLNLIPKNNSNVIEMSNETFNELKSMTDKKGAVDIGRYLQSEAFNEWLYSDFNPQVDDRVVSQIYKSIVNSYEDKDKGQEVAARFVNVVATNKPNYVFPTRRKKNEEATSVLDQLSKVSFKRDRSLDLNPGAGQ